MRDSPCVPPGVQGLTHSWKMQIPNCILTNAAIPTWFLQNFPPNSLFLPPSQGRETPISGTAESSQGQAVTEDGNPWLPQHGRNSPNSPISHIISTFLPFSEAQQALNRVTPSELVWKAIFLFFFPAARRKFAVLSPPHFKPEAPSALCGSQKVSVSLINNLQPLWSPSKINCTSVRPKNPQPTQEKNT